MSGGLKPGLLTPASSPDAEQQLQLLTKKRRWEEVVCKDQHEQSCIMNQGPLG